MRTELEIKAQPKNFKSLMQKYKSQDVAYNLGFIKALEWTIEKSELKNETK